MSIGRESPYVIQSLHTNNTKMSCVIYYHFKFFVDKEVRRIDYSL